MPFMALQAEERLVLNQHVIGDGTMGIVADGAVVLNGGMPEYERTLVAGVAVQTQVVGALIGVEAFAGGTVDVVAAGAVHLAFFNRMR